MISEELFSELQHFTSFLNTDSNDVFKFTSSINSIGRVIGYFNEFEFSHHGNNIMIKVA